MKTNVSQILSLVGCAVLLAGCAQHQKQSAYTHHPEAAHTGQPPPANAGGEAVYFPSGQAEGGGLMIQKSAPAQVLVGRSFAYTYKVSNLTAATLENVTVMDRVSGNFTAADSDPKAASVAGGVAVWHLGALGPKESRMITVNGSSPDEGTVTTCGWATYNPTVCQEIHVVRANVSLTKTAPSDALICDVIPVALTVENTGSSALTDVQITDNLPNDLTSDGKSSLMFDIGNLAPGESKEINYNATATATGKFISQAKVSSAEGASAEAEAATTVHQPILAITSRADDQQYMGRQFNVSYTVSNTGDAAAEGTQLEVAIPASLNVVSADNGQVADNKITWDLGTVDANSPQTVNVVLSSPEAGTFEFPGTAHGTCAEAVAANCSTRVIGHAAVLLEKADDPDPVAVGETTTYTVKVTNQGTAEDHNVQVVVTVDSPLRPVSSSEGTINGQTITLPTVATLAPKQSVTYQIVAKGVAVGEAHTSVKLASEVLRSPIVAEESTHVY